MPAGGGVFLAAMVSWASAARYAASSKFSVPVAPVAIRVIDHQGSFAMGEHERLSRNHVHDMLHVRLFDLGAGDLIVGYAVNRSVVVEAELLRRRQN